MHRSAGITSLHYDPTSPARSALRSPPSAELLLVVPASRQLRPLARRGQGPRPRRHRRRDRPASSTPSTTSTSAATTSSKRSTAGCSPTSPRRTPPPPSTPRPPASSSTASPSSPSRSTTPARRPTAPSATDAHRQRNPARLALLEEQRTDLAGCLDALWTAVQRGATPLQTLPPDEDVQRPRPQPCRLHAQHPATRGS